MGKRLTNIFIQLITSTFKYFLVSMYIIFKAYNSYLYQPYCDRTQKDLLTTIQ